MRANCVAKNLRNTRMSDSTPSLASLGSTASLPSTPSVDAPKPPRKRRPLVIEGADPGFAEVLVELVEGEIKGAAEKMQIDRIEGLLSWRRALKDWLDDPYAPEKVVVAPAKARERPKPTSEHGQVKSTLGQAVAWYRAREGRQVLGGPGAWQLEGRDEQYSDAAMLHLVNVSRRRAGQPEIVVGE